MRFDRLSLLTILLGILACSGPTSVTEDQFTIRATGREVVLSNAADETTYYLLVEKETAAFIDLPRCVQTAECPHVAPGAAVRVPYSGIIGYEPGRREAIVHWWRSAPAGAPQGEAFHSTVFEL